MIEKHIPAVASVRKLSSTQAWHDVCVCDVALHATAERFKQRLSILKASMAVDFLITQHTQVE